MVYKNGPKFKIRKVVDIKEDLVEARKAYGERVRTLFFPSGNSIIMRTAHLCDICGYAQELFPELERITVYGSSQYIHKKGVEDLQKIKEAGLSRIHAGLESGDDIILKKIKKGTDSAQQIEAGQWAMEAGIEMSLYVILGIGGQDRSRQHAIETAKVLNRISPDFIRLRTFVPKINTPMLEEVQKGTFVMLGPHDILKETALLIENLDVSSTLTSDHYTNYINIEGKLPEDKSVLLEKIKTALEYDESSFRPFFIGNQ